jgi:tRNA pseudouridine65 synthase
MEIQTPIQLEILSQVEDLVAIEKPEGFHVHPHEIARHRAPREHTCLYLLRDQLGQKVYPVHRLDVSTSGVLFFALSSAAARDFHQLLQNQLIQKTYVTVLRGWLTGSGLIDIPMPTDTSDGDVPCFTSYCSLAHIELPHAVGPRYPTARYSLVMARPHTGRWHQIRRHFARISHPVLGDATHGDSKHNQFFRTYLGYRGLCLRAQETALHWRTQPLTVRSHLPPKWLRIAEVFGLSREGLIQAMSRGCAEGRLTLR